MPPAENKKWEVDMDDGISHATLVNIRQPTHQAPGASQPLDVHVQARDDGATP